MHPTSPSRKNRLIYIINTASIVIALATCLWLIQKNRALRDVVRTVNTDALEKTRVRVGDILPSVRLVDLEDQPTNVFFERDERVKLVQIISVTCGACMLQLQDWWPRLISDPRLLSLRPILITLETPKETLAAMDPKDIVGEVLSSQSKLSFERGFRVVKVPELLLLSPTGEVEWVHHGILDESSYEVLLNKVSK